VANSTNKKQQASEHGAILVQTLCLQIQYELTCPILNLVKTKKGEQGREETAIDSNSPINYKCLFLLTSDQTKTNHLLLITEKTTTLSISLFSF